MAEPFFHLNSCVYEILLQEDGTTRNFMKQVNNPILCQDLVFAEEEHTTPTQIITALTDNWKRLIGERENEPYAREPLIYTCYPIANTNELFDKLIVITGITLKGKMPDLNKPVIRKLDDPDAVDKTYEPTFTQVPFIFIMPITPNYMCDITLSHVPASAVINAKNITNSMPAPSQGINFNTQMADGSIPQSQAEKVIQEVDRQKLMWLSNGHDESTFVVDVEMAAARLGMDKQSVQILL